MSVAKAEVSRSCRCEAPTPSTNTKHLHQGRSRAGHPGCSSDSMCCHGHPVLPWAGQAGIIPSPWRCRNGFLPLTASVGCLRGQGWSSPGLGCHSRLREYLGDVQRAVRTALTYPISQPRCGDDSCCQQFTSDQKLQAGLLSPGCCLLSSTFGLGQSQFRSPVCLSWPGVSHREEGLQLMGLNPALTLPVLAAALGLSLLVQGGVVLLQIWLACFICPPFLQDQETFIS